MQGRNSDYGKEQSNICVVIRKRPLNKKQIGRSEHDVVEVINGKGIIVREHKLKVDLTKYIQQHSFAFDQAYGDEVRNQQLYDGCVRPIVKCAFQGAKVTCFAYGQTGSGKTFTMNGDIENGCPGMYYLGAEDIFAIRDTYYQQLTFTVSYYEIYCGKLYDLLNNREQLQIREDGKQNVNIIGLTIKKVESIQQFMETIMYGSSVRITSQNSTNADSSRSHAILQISLMNKNKIHGKISFIDLAGCERGADTLEQNKQTKIDGAQINKSLLALKECIRALDLGKNHTPFRGSKLTMVLKDSFTGFCRTLMIGNVSPNSGSCENTLNTLRYADRVKELRKTSNVGDLGRQEQLSRELMLPRNKKARQILIKNESEEEQTSLVIKDRREIRNVVIQKVNKISKPSRDKRVSVMNKVSNRKVFLQECENIQHSANHYNKNQPKRIIRNKSLLVKDINTDYRNNEFTKDIRTNNAISSAQNTRHIKLNHPEFRNNEDDKLKYLQAYTSLKNPCKQDVVYHHLTDYKQWNKILQKFREWVPHPNQLEVMSGLFEQLVKYIMRQQLELSELHENCLVKEENSYKQCLLLFNENQKGNKNNEEMEDYAGRFSNFLMNRAVEFNKWREKVQDYRYHLRQHQMCEAKLIEAGQIIHRQSIELYLENTSQKHY